MELYHVSCKKYDNGTILSSASFSETEYYKKSKTENKNWIDETLDQNKPKNFPERKKVLFAFDNLGNCLAFKKEQYVFGLNFYKVEMKNPIACPMCLTDALIEKKESLNQKISKEYWKPEKNWKFLEYLSCEMTIIEKVSEPSLLELIAAKERYQCDFEMADNLKKQTLLSENPH